MADTKNGKKNSQQSAGATQPIQGNEPVKVTAANATPGQSKSAKNPQPKISKMEAVRKTLSSLGREAKPTEMQAYIKKTFGVEMTKDHISNYKLTVRSYSRVFLGIHARPFHTSQMADPRVREGVSALLSTATIARASAR